MVTLNSIAELRRAKETADFFDSLSRLEQREWLDELLNRIRYSASREDVPYVCLLDTGISLGHKLLEPAIDSDDVHTIEPAWGTNDSHGHGTQMAGLALAGNLTEVLDSSEYLHIGHRLESVKLLPESGSGGEDSFHHGVLTIEAVNRPYVSAPYRRRVFSMAVTARDNRDFGKPSSWSSTLDALAADVDGQGAEPRLILVSAGNVDDPSAWSLYPESNDSDQVHDPAQAWNVVTVGAFTNLIRITEPDAENYEPIAPAGGLSPFSTTTLAWKRNWPLKPDIVLEGGNAAEDSLSAVQMPSLSLLTTHHNPSERYFTTTNATSAATALASRLAAQIMNEYPKLWPETVRAMIVHSAEWTQTMRRKFLPSGGKIGKKEYLQLVRRCGFGVPNLDRALWSLSNSLTMVVQESIKPFKKLKGKQPTMCDMHLHSLPWPEGALNDLGEEQVEMRVTLSYFIEPNPSHRGSNSAYRYQSHGFRFDVKRPLETVAAFRSRINAAALSEEVGSKANDGDPAWLIGSQGRRVGSIHSDIWRGTAADLASRGCIAVYPSLGWWRSRPKLKRYDHEARYALAVSIKAPEVDVDIYSAVETEIINSTIIST